MVAKKRMDPDILYELLDTLLQSDTLDSEIFVCLGELYYQNQPTFVPWFDYNRICCDQCYEEILRDDRCTQSWLCIRCAKSQLLPLSESRVQYDQLCQVRYQEMVEALRPMVREEIRQRRRVKSLLGTFPVKWILPVD